MSLRTAESIVFAFTPDGSKQRKQITTPLRGPRHQCIQNALGKRRRVRRLVRRRWPSIVASMLLKNFNSAGQPDTFPFQIPKLALQLLTAA